MSEHLSEQRIELDVHGMTCDACALHVTKALQGVAGVLHVDVPGWRSGKAILSTRSDVDEAQLIRAVERAGYRAGIRTSAPTPTLILGERPGERAAATDRDFDFDLAVIGTGGGGMAAAIKAAELGRRAALIEADILGGTCVNIGCVPSKTLIRAAEAYHRAGHHPFAGVHTQAVGLDWPAVVGQKDELVAELRQGKYADVLASYGDAITLIRGRARLRPDAGIVLDDGRTLTAGRIIIATGAAPRILPLAGIEDVEVLTSTSAMALPELPRSLIVIGGRAIALELGQAFARFGTEVTILQRSLRLIPEHEPEIGEALADYLRAEGLMVYTGVRPLAIRREGDEKVVTVAMNGAQREFRAEHVLMAVGRTPRTRNMGLEEAGVRLDRDGFIVVNEFMQTTNPRIYATGDVTQHPKLVYVAAAGGGIAAANALEGNHKRLDLSVLPNVIFTDPQVATVGLTAAQAHERGYDVKTTILPLAYVPRALVGRDTRGLIKLVADGSSNRLLGAHMLAAEAGEVIQSAALAVHMGLRYGFTVDDLREMLFPYLTQVEGLKLAAQTFAKNVAQLSCCAS